MEHDSALAKPLTEILVREQVTVARHDRVCTPGERRCDDVSVIGITQDNVDLDSRKRWGKKAKQRSDRIRTDVVRPKLRACEDVRYLSDELPGQDEVDLPAPNSVEHKPRVAVGEDEPRYDDIAVNDDAQRAPFSPRGLPP